MNETTEGEAARPFAALAEGRAATTPRPRIAYGTRVVLPAVLLLGFGGLTAWAARGSLVPAAEVEVVPVVVREVEGRVASTSVAERQVVAQASGWLEPDPTPVLVNGLADGVVREVLVLEGDRVEANQPVATLIDDDARLALRQAEAELARATARLEAARTRWENPTDRRLAVASAEARVRQMEAELAKLVADVAAERARADELKTLFRQARALFDRDAATETELDTARQRYEAQRASLDAAQKRRAVLEAQLAAATAELAAATRDAELRVEEAEALATARAMVDQATAARDEAALRLDRMTVRSPIAGVVMTRHKDVGSKVMARSDHHLSTTVVRLYDPRHLQARIDVPLADAAKIGVGMPAEVIVSALPDTTFAGEVTRVVNEADVTRNTLQVKVAVADPDPRLKPEMLARVKFFQLNGAADEVTPTSDRVVFAPTNLVENGRAWVVVDGVAERRDVTLGDAREGDWVEVTAGLMPGDRLIADPENLDEGGRVRVVGEEEGGDDGLR